MGVVSWQLIGLWYCIKGVIGVIVHWVCIDLVVTGDGVEGVDIENWSEDEEVSLDGRNM